VIDPAGRQGTELPGTVCIKAAIVMFSNRCRKKLFPAASARLKRLGKALRKGIDDGCDTYRIPGLVTTDAGPLIAVNDKRFNSKKDLFFRKIPVSALSFTKTDKNR